MSIIRSTELPYHFLIFSPDCPTFLTALEEKIGLDFRAFRIKNSSPMKNFPIRLSKLSFLLAYFAILFHTAFAADEKPLVEDDFERTELGKGWTIQTGAWEIREGALHGAEIPEDNHSAAARRVVQTTDATYQMKFRLTEGAKAFHFGFDPARGELKKRGHLFSVIISPKGWRIMKHVDKDRPKEDPNEVLATASNSFETGKWYSLEVVTDGTSVTATIDGFAPLKAEHPTFGVKKPTLVYRVIGDGVDIDDISVKSNAAE